MNSNNFVMWGNTAQQSRLGLFQNSDFAGGLEDSKSTSKENLMHFRKSHVRANELDVRETDLARARPLAGETLAEWLTQAQTHSRTKVVRTPTCWHLVGSSKKFKWDMDEKKY